MIVYSGLKSDFLTAVEQDTIATEIEDNIYNKMHRSIYYVNNQHLHGNANCKSNPDGKELQ